MADKQHTTTFDDRLARQKGFVEYNPSESFVIHVQWVVANRKAAEEMLEALKTCAAATARDAPPTLAYFFRVSHDQSLAQAMKAGVTTLGEHPQYKKKFKLAEMGLSAPVVAAGCEREGLSGKPFREGWEPDRPMDAVLAEELGFDPVVLDLTEVYLDSRAFVDHASSRDYLAAYGVLMQPHRNLSVHTVVAGTPTDAVWDRVLEPALKARRAAEPERLNLCCESWRDAAADAAAGGYVLLDMTFPDGASADNFGTTAAASGSSPFQCVFQCASNDDTEGNDNRSFRVVAALLLSGASDPTIREAAQPAQSGRALLFWSTTATASSARDGSAAVSDELGDDAVEQLQKVFGGRIDVVDMSVVHSETPTKFAGFGLSAKLADLKADDTVKCEDITEMS